ncbi:MAG: FecR family protein [Candidatus Wallbacteria bacterium]|nr:FecR family protein [Candidatus Wallbacteria bacterium]
MLCVVARLRVRIIILAFFALIQLVSADQKDTSSFQFISGQVSIIRGDKVIQPESGTELLIGDEVRTGPDGYAKIILAWSGIIKVRPDTSFIIPETSNQPQRISFIRMLKGILWARARKDDDSLRISTSHAICGVRGTEFIVAVESDSVCRLKVAEGEVAFVPVVEGMVPKALMVRAGQQIRLDVMKLAGAVEEQMEGAANKAADGLLRMGSDAEEQLLDVGQKVEEKLMEWGEKAEANLVRIGRKIGDKAMSMAEKAENRARTIMPSVLDEALAASLDEGLYDTWHTCDFSSAGITFSAVSALQDPEFQEFRQ